MRNGSWSWWRVILIVMILVWVILRFKDKLPSQKLDDFLKRNTQETEYTEPQDAGEIINDMMESCLFVVGEESDYKLSESQLLVNAIIENTKVKTKSDDGESCVVQIWYPDAATIMLKELGKYSQNEDINFDELYKTVRSKVCRSKKKTKVTLTVEYTIDQDGDRTILMTPELERAISGGLANYEE